MTTTNPKAELETVKKYILRCPDVSPNSMAIRVSIQALDNELKRMERDDKLRLKFTTQQQQQQQEEKNSSACSSSDEIVSVLSSDDIVRLEMNSNTNNNVVMKHNTSTTAATSNDDGMNEWEEVLHDNKFTTSQQCNTAASTTTPTQSYDSTTITKMEDVVPPTLTSNNNNTTNSEESTAFGTALAQRAIVDLSTSNTTVSTPTAALALVVHAALRSSLLGFKCMGIPEEQNCFTGTEEEEENIDGIVGKRKKKARGSGGGFAAPVRELPRGVFLPKQWDQYASSSSTNNSTNDIRDCHGVSLRYSKNGMPSTALRVMETKIKDNDDDDDEHKTTTTTTMMNICFGPLGGTPAILTFPVDRHVNLDGLSAALSLLPPGSSSSRTEGGGVKPALHFKALAALLANFCTVADVGRVVDVLPPQQKEMEEEDGGNGASSCVDHTSARYDSFRNMAPIPLASPQTMTMMTGGSTFMEAGRPPSIQGDLLGVTHRTAMSRGDFADDLGMQGHLPLPGMPSSTHNPRHDGSGGGLTGNLMGPNHPHFQNHQYNNDDDDDDCMGYPGNGGVGDDFIIPGGGLGMQPRFDPFYPPGVGGGRGGRGGRGRGGRGRGRGGRFTGDPNHDHQQLPNTFGGNRNMFM